MPTAEQRFVSFPNKYGPYVDRINSWFYTVLPWELGKNLQRKDVEDVAQLADFLGYQLKEK